MKHCFLCKEVYSSFNKRSFHTFPKDAVLKMKWLNILNLPTSFEVKSQLICSDHFSEECFNIVEGQVKRKLQTGSLPCASNISDQLTTTDEVTGIAVNTTNGSLTSTNNETAEIPNTTAPKDPSADISNQLNTTDEVTGVAVNSINDLSTSTINEVSICDMNDLENNVHNKEIVMDCPSPISTSTQMKQTSVSTSESKKMKFMDGCKLYYISREDFKNDEGWNKFLIYKRLQEKKMAAAHSKNSRRKKKITVLSDIIQNLENNNENGQRIF